MSGVNLSGIADWTHTLNMIPSLSVIRLPFCSLHSASQSIADFNLTNLEILDLSANVFDHSIASAWFWKATSLKYINLSLNNFYGLLHDALENMTFLKVLDLSENRNTDHYLTVTGNLNKLCNIEIIDFSKSSMTGDIMMLLPQCAWQKLQELHFSQNGFTGALPNFIGNFTDLRTLDLSNNNLNGSVPNEIGALSNLIYLDLSYNDFSGMIVEEHLADLISLKFLDLSSNNLEVVMHKDWFPPFRLEYGLFASCHMGPLFPAWLKWQLDIKRLVISNTALVGNIPDWFYSTFSKATRIDVSQNQINGSLPAQHLDGMAILEQNVSSNKLTGSIQRLPRNITKLDISNNSFSGTLHSIFEALQLEVLVAFSNQIDGSIPESMCKLKNLDDLDLSSNLLEGEMPLCLGTNYNPSYLLLSNNSLSGNFPSILQNSIDLLFLDLSWNQFSGSLPTWMGQMKKLQFLRLSHNTFSGSIPAEMACLTLLQFLDLSYNSLSGVIPQELSNLTGMIEAGINRIITVGYSITHGNITDYITIGSQFEEILSIILKGKQRSYGSTLAYFVGIDLSSNSLTGAIPRDVTSLDALISLTLSSNHLSGTIPNKIGDLQSLECLDLSNNNLSGEIPSSLSNLTSLSYMNLSYNNLFGRIPIGRQLDTLNTYNPSLMYIGNSGLCGPPLQKHCSGNGTIIPDHHGSNRQELEPMSFYVGLGSGLLFGLWMIFCVLLFKRTWRIAYFQLFDKLYDRTYVFVLLKWSSLIGNPTTK
ncbi:unnamed protein product [Urochloa decumbens]|uniref:Uncharacterized protein n=1 Tax=Urochloa decumbens TaxID=240449 RepID=A0ABC9BU33_9POAL